MPDARPQPPTYPHRMALRVRYPEADSMGRVHHGVYLQYFEMGRTEYMRARGVTYREMEAAGHFIAIAGIEVKYRAGARYDDLLIIETWVKEVRGARVFFANRVLRDDGGGRETLIAEAVVGGALLVAGGQPRRFTEEEAAVMLGPPKNPAPNGA